MTDNIIKVSRDGKRRYRLRIGNNKHVIFRNSGAQGREAEFSDRIIEFSDEIKAKSFLSDFCN